MLILNIILGAACVLEGKQVACTLREWTVVKCVVETTAVLAVTMWWEAIKFLMPVVLVWNSMTRCVIVSSL
jgi:hypothetical protein